VSKIHLVFKRFHVQSFVSIRHRVGIFILNFSKYRVFTLTHVYSSIDARANHADLQNRFPVFPKQRVVLIAALKI
jgi:hypothetical protein